MLKMINRTNEIGKIKAELFRKAYENNKLEDMKQYFEPSFIHYFYLDVALEEGKESIVKFFIDKGVFPSLYSNQMARINGFSKLANYVDSQCDFRNKIDVGKLYHLYDRDKKKMIWTNDLIPIDYKYQLPSTKK
jgi:hypothetical protein